MSNGKEHEKEFLFCTQETNTLQITCMTQMVKNLPVMQETRFDPWVMNIP